MLHSQTLSVPTTTPVINGRRGFDGAIFGHIFEVPRLMKVRECWTSWPFPIHGPVPTFSKETGLAKCMWCSTLSVPVPMMIMHIAPWRPRPPKEIIDRDNRVLVIIVMASVGVSKSNTLLIVTCKAVEQSANQCQTGMWPCVGGFVNPSR